MGVDVQVMCVCVCVCELVCFCVSLCFCEAVSGGKTDSRRTQSDTSLCERRTRSPVGIRTRVKLARASRTAGRLRSDGVGSAAVMTSSGPDGEQGAHSAPSRERVCLGAFDLPIRPSVAIPEWPLRPAEQNGQVQSRMVRIAISCSFEKF